MVKQVIGETFETLGGIAKQTGKQIVQIPFEIAEAVPGQVGAKTAREVGIEQPQGGQTQNPVQQALNKKATERKLTYLQDELKRLKQQKAQELPKQATGQPGFSEKTAIKQLQVEKKKEPLPIVQAKRSSGTGERRIKGISG